MSESDGPLDPTARRRLESMARFEMEGAEMEAAELAVRSQTLADVAWEAVQRGDRITVRTGKLEITGLAVYARGDLVSVESRFGLVEIRLSAVDSMSVAAAPAESGRSVPREAESFIARLGLLQLGQESVEVVMRSAGQRAEGVLRRVARDHLVLDGPSGSLLVALDAVAWVIRRSP